MLSSSQLPVPAAGPQPMIAAEKIAVKPGKVMRGPIGRAEIAEWQAAMCCITPLGTCCKPQSPDSIYCLSHTCQAINVDGERCTNAIYNPRQSRFCSNGWHVENSKYKNVVDLVTRRKQLDEADAIKRRKEAAEQMVLFEAQFFPLTSANKTSSSSNNSVNEHADRQNVFSRQW
ncbi:hypothetical protein L204_103912 [Cryptococcus depauperatus]